MPCKAEEKSGLSPADDENAAGRKMNRKDVYFFMGGQYKMSRFVAFDVETPNTFHSRICAVGLTVVENGKVLDTVSFLVNPETDFSWANTRIHGISEYDVLYAPTFPELWRELGPLLRSGVVAAHNAAFDMRVLRETLNSYEIYEPPLSGVCTLRLSRKFLPGSPNYRLDTLCGRYGIPLRHHDAGSDSAACAELLALIEGSGANLSSYIKNYPMQE